MITCGRATVYPEKRGSLGPNLFDAVLPVYKLDKCFAVSHSTKRKYGYNIGCLGRMWGVSRVARVLGLSYDREGVRMVISLGADATVLGLMTQFWLEYVAAG